MLKTLRVVVLSFFLSVYFPSLCFASDNVHLVQSFFNLVNTGRVPFQSRAMRADELTQTGWGRYAVQIEGTVLVPNGQLQTVQVMVNGDRARDGLFQVERQGGQQGMIQYSFRGTTPIDPSRDAQLQLVFVLLRADGSIEEALEPAAPVELVFRNTSFQAEVTDAKFHLNGGREVPFQNLTLSENDFSNNRIYATGRLLVGRGRFSEARLFLNGRPASPVPCEPAGDGSYYWHSDIPLKPGEITGVSVQFIGNDLFGGGSPVTVPYPRAPAELNVGAGALKIEMQSAEIGLNDGRGGFRFVPFRDMTIHSSDLVNGSIVARGNAKVESGSFVRLMAHGGGYAYPVYDNPSVPRFGDYPWSADVRISSGETAPVFLTFHERDSRSGTAKNEPSFTYPQRPALITFEAPRATQFEAAFTSLTVKAMIQNGPQVKFEDVPAEGLKIYAREPREVIQVSAAWRVTQGEALAVYMSRDGGQTWMGQPFVSDRNATSGSQQFEMERGASADLAFKIIGRAPNSQTSVTIFEPRRAKVTVSELPAFAAQFSDVRVQAGSRTSVAMDQPLNGQEIFSDSPVSMKVTAKLDVTAGTFFSAEYSLGGAWYPMVVQLSGPGISHGTAEAAFSVPPGSTAHIRLRVSGLDGTQTMPGNPRTLVHPHSATVIIYSNQVNALDAVFLGHRISIPGWSGGFSSLPAEGKKIYSEDKVAVEVSAIFELRKGGASSQVSKDGGHAWVPIPFENRRGMPTDESIQKQYFREQVTQAFELAPGESADFVFAAKGHDTNQARQPVGAEKTIIDSSHAKISVEFKKSVPGAATISDVAFSTVYDPQKGESPDHYLLEKAGPEIAVSEEFFKESKTLVWITQCDQPVSAIKASLDGGRTWESVSIQQSRLSYQPELGREYDVVFKVMLGGGKETDPVDYVRKKIRFKLKEPAGIKPAEDVEKTLQEMTHAYESEDFSAFMSRVSEEFPNRGELEEFARRDFRDYDGIRIQLFPGRVVDIPGGKSIGAAWEMRSFPMALAKQIQVRGGSVDFLFVEEGGKFKLKNMRGTNPLFAARSPEIAVTSGVSQTVYQALRKIEDEGKRNSKLAAITLVGSEIVSGIETIPVTFRIINSTARYLDGGQEAVNLDAMQTARPIAARATLRLVDNPKNIDFTGVKLQVSDSLTGTSVSFTGDMPANQDVTFVFTDSFIFPLALSGRSGTLTFELDPNDRFPDISDEERIVRVPYTLA